jgi:uncharacterized protein involved in exopolysaccharide biosynthesis
VLKSRDLLEKIALSDYEMLVAESEPKVKGRQTLVELYSDEGEPYEEQVRKTVARLSRDISTRVHGRSSLITLTTTSISAELAVQINQRMLELLQEFNVDSRQERGRAERGFIEERLEQAQTELKDAEQAFERFLDENRNFHGSPRLGIESTRLQQRVQLRQQMYLSLLQMYEQARVDEMRNTPIITIFDAPKYTGTSARRRVMLLALLGTALGGMVAVVLTFGAEYWNWLRRVDQERYAALVMACRNVLVGQSIATRRARRMSSKRMDGSQSV